MDEIEREELYGDIFNIYEPEIIFPPEFDDPEPTPENNSYYVIDMDGVKWFYCMNWRTRVTEYFPETGKTVGELIEDAVKFAAKNEK